MSEISSEMNVEMDLFRYYIHGIRALITEDDGVESGSLRSNEMGKEGSGCNEKNRLLFSNAVGNRLSAYRKERLLAMLCQSVVALNREVDEMMDPVFKVVELRSILAPEKNGASCKEIGKDESVERAHKKRLKVNEPLNVSSTSCNLTDEGSFSERKGVVQLGKGKSSTKCNNMGCRNYSQKTNFDEIKTLCGDCSKSKQGMTESFLGSSSRDDKENGEVFDALQVLLANKDSKVKEKVEKHSALIYATLEGMKVKLEELVDTVISSCREMTPAEKHKLRGLIKNLHPQNLDHVVKIIQRGSPPEKQSKDDITIDLLKEDNSTLWKIYFHVKAVENARKLL